MLEFKLIKGIDGYNAVKNIRNEIFSKAHGLSENTDEHDSSAWHIACYDNDKVVASARLYEKEQGIFSIGYVAVSDEYRKQYIGDTLLRALEDKAVQLMGYMIEVDALESAVGFWEKEGYEKCESKLFPDGKIRYEMIKDLTKPFVKCKSCKQKNQ